MNLHRSECSIFRSSQNYSVFKNCMDCFCRTHINARGNRSDCREHGDADSQGSSEPGYLGRASRLADDMGKVSTLPVPQSVCSED